MSQDQESRQVRKTKQALRDALIQLVDERGFDALTVKDITDRADVGRATFYVHFEDKTALLKSIADVVYEQFAEIARSTPPESAALPAIELLLERVTEHPRLYQVALNQTGVVEHLRHYLVHEFDHRLAALGATQPTPAAQIAAGALEGLIRWWLANDLELPATEVADLYRRFLVQGVPAVVDPGAMSPHGFGPATTPRPHDNRP